MPKYFVVVKYKELGSNFWKDMHVALKQHFNLTDKK